MGCLGQVTKLFGHFFRVVTGRFVIYRLQALKWYQETLATHGVQPTCQNPDLASRLIRCYTFNSCKPQVKCKYRHFLVGVQIVSRNLLLQSFSKILGEERKHFHCIESYQEFSWKTSKLSENKALAMSPLSKRQWIVKLRKST